MTDMDALMRSVGAAAIAASPENLPDTETESTETEAPAEVEQETEEVVEEAPAADSEESEEQEETEEAETETEASKPATYKVKADGEEHEVTLDELLKGYSRTANYTRDKQAVSAEKKAVSEQKAQYAERLQQYSEKLEIVEEIAKNALGPAPDWEKVKAELPADQYLLARQEYEDQAARVQKVVAERQKALTEKAKIDDEKFQEHINKEWDILLEKLPEWKDEAKAKAGYEKITNYARQNLGMSAEQVQALSNHVHVMLIHKAMMYDEAQAKGKDIPGKLKAKVAAAPVLKPGAAESAPKTVDKGKEAAKRHRKEGSVESLASLLDSL